MHTADVISLRLPDPQDGRAEWVRAAWPRLKLDRERLALFASLYADGGPDALPPITIVRHPDGFLLADGVHRVCAAWSLGWKQLPASVIDPPANVSAKAYATILALQNATQGPLSLTFQERKRAALRLLRHYSNLSHRHIARLTGVSPKSVDRWANEETNEPDQDFAASRVAFPDALSLAKAWLRRMQALEAHKPLSDALFGDRMPQRLAQAARAVFGKEALERVNRYAAWWNAAARRLEGEKP